MYILSSSIGISFVLIVFLYEIRNNIDEHMLQMYIQSFAQPQI